MGAQSIPRVEDYTSKSQRGANRAERDDARARQERVREVITKPSLHFEWFETIEPAEEEWLVHEILPKRGVACIYGGVQSGKSFLALDWGLSIAAGFQVMDVETERVGVAYIGPEGTAGLRKRIKAWRETFRDQLDGERPSFALVGNSLDLRNATAQDVGLLIAALQENAIVFRENGAPLGLVIIDTFATVTAGMAENSPEGMTAAVGALQRIALETGALVVALHHTGKDEERGLRGHSSLLAALDTTVEVTHDRTEGLHTVHLRKQKDMDGDRVLGAFRRCKVDLGVSRKGNPIVGAYIEYESAPTPRASKATRARVTDQPLSKATKNTLSNQGAPAPKHVADVIGRGVKVVRRDAVQRQAAQMGLSRLAVMEGASKTDKDRAAKEFQRSIESLIGQEIIGQHKVSVREMYIWLSKGS